MPENKFPKLFLYCEDGEGCGCQGKVGGGVKELEVPMKIDDGNVLLINLFEYGAMPKLGDASEIEAVRVHIRAKEVMVYAIYNDPMKTAINSCCSGSGCTCYASGCYC